MNFFLTEEQKLMRQAIRELCDKEFAPRAAEWDRTHTFPRVNFLRLAELGYLNLQLPEPYGGAVDWVTYAIVIEELARACATTSVMYEVHCSLHSEAICNFGTQAQKDRYLPRLTAGELLGAYALTEPGAGSDPAALQARAERRGGDYVLSGQKTFCTNGGEADLYIVFARTDPTGGSRTISAFLIEKGTPGFTFGKPMEKMGIRGSATTDLYLDNVVLPAEQRLGEEGDGLKMALAILDGGRIGIAAQAVGITQAALEECVRHSQQRETFGKPIAEHQAIAFKLADMATELDAARLLLYRAAFLRGQGLRATGEIAMAKLFASEVCMRQTVEAVQIFGGYGYIAENKVERLMRDAKITQIYEGTSEIQKIVISRNLLRNQATNHLVGAGV